MTIQGYLNDVLLTRVFGLKAIIPFSQLIPRTDLGVLRWDQPVSGAVAVFQGCTTR